VANHSVEHHQVCFTLGIRSPWYQVLFVPRSCVKAQVSIWREASGRDVRELKLWREPDCVQSAPFVATFNRLRHEHNRHSRLWVMLRYESQPVWFALLWIKREIDGVIIPARVWAGALLRRFSGTT